LFPDGWEDGGGLFDVLICTSELVNASLLANSTTMDLRLLVRDQIVRVSLLDDCGVPAAWLDNLTHAQTFVLRLLDSVTNEWGIDPDPAGRVLWFEVNVD
jgi:hypothetical protein